MCKECGIWGLKKGMILFLMSSYELSFGLIFEEAVIIRLLLVNRLLLLGYVFVVGHMSSG